VYDALGIPLAARAPMSALGDLTMFDSLARDSHVEARLRICFGRAL
jgi:hypothetical protein